MSRIFEELEQQGIEVTYENIAIFAVFVSEEGLVERLQLNEELAELTWPRDLFVTLPPNS